MVMVAKLKNMCRFIEKEDIHVQIVYQVIVIDSIPFYK